ncbi:MAG: hypothetical protein DCO96_14685 [Fluviicola sp. XM-24bin1]|nr:MAG: hypothetical protein DCO96_14685 [Fluviicola sp. XM-24bin1]
MKNNVNTTVSKKHKVVLTLLGIDKEWVRFNGQWVDLATLPTDTEKSDYELNDSDSSTRKWWKFWSRS